MLCRYLEVLLCGILLQQHLIECQLFVGQHVVLSHCLLDLTCIRLRCHRLATLGECLSERHLATSRVMDHLICIRLGISTATLPRLVTQRQLVHVLDVVIVQY